MNSSLRPVSQLGLILALLVLALTLRPSMAAIGPVLPFIQQELPFSFSLASLLTMLPVLAMGLGILCAHYFAQKLGPYLLIFWAAAAIGLATLIRLWSASVWDLILTAVVSGLGIAMVQAVAPAVIKQRFASHAALVMGWYISAIIAGAALAASLSAYLAEALQSWRLALGGWALLSVLALLAWFSQRSGLRQLAAPGSGQNPLGYRKYRRGWTLAWFFGLVTCAFTCVLAWLPAYYVELGWPEPKAGLLLGFMISMEVLSGIVSPMLASRLYDRRPVLLALALLMLAGFAGLVLWPAAAWLWAALLGLGIGGLFPLSLIVAMDHRKDAQQAASLTAFVQAVGYTLAAFSPLVAGLIRDLTQSFSLSWLVLALVCLLVLWMAGRFNPAGYADCFAAKSSVT
ncbi:MFS transporter [Rheinheimera marina]|uniref:MFS transporter n=1 Tax=Rheinheimera marina TaxID=1774958 RepID=A0ABV9JL62_9GAMM